MSVASDPFPLKGRYADLNRFETLAGPGDARPTAAQIIHDENLVGSMADKTFLVTGAASGIGAETVRALALTGARVIGTVRDMEKGRTALGDLMGEKGGRVELVFMDQASLASVRECAEEVKRRTERLNVVVNNAAVMNTPFQKTTNGFELQLATNHLSHFLLTRLLQHLLLASSTPAFHSRVVNVSSAAHRFSPPRLTDPNFTTPGAYNGWAAYASSKTANIYMTSALERRHGKAGLHGLALHPGSFFSPNLQVHSEKEREAALESERFRRYTCSPAQGAATSVYAAVSREVEGVGGVYLEGCSVAVGERKETGEVVEHGYAPWVFDESREEELWGISERMVGIS